jgi:hypothetical protein
MGATITVQIEIPLEIMSCWRARLVTFGTGRRHGLAQLRASARSVRFSDATKGEGPCLLQP